MTVHARRRAATAAARCSSCEGRPLPVRGFVEITTMYRR